jgi:hypothetical protein
MIPASYCYRPLFIYSSSLPLDVHQSRILPAEADHNRHLLLANRVLPFFSTNSPRPDQISTAPFILSRSENESRKEQGLRYETWLHLMCHHVHAAVSMTSHAKVLHGYQEPYKLYRRGMQWVPGRTRRSFRLHF